MHGPLQFHLVGLAYFLFGDSDFSARIPAVITSILSAAFLWNYRRYLGRAGALIAAGLFLISPYMLYYGRYVRNEAFVVLWGLITLWAILRYLESGLPRYLLYLTAATVLHFTTKETAFIYTAQALLFLGLLFVQRITARKWGRPDYRRYFIIALIVTLLLFAAGLGYGVFARNLGALNPAETAAPVVPGEDDLPLVTGVPTVFTIATLTFGGLALAAALFLLIRGYTWARLREERSFDMLILLGTLVLPQLAPFPVKFAGWDALDYSATGMFRTSLFLVPLVIISLAIGLLWKPRLWLANAGLFYAIFIVFYTTVFTNGGGFFTGLVGSLGYWLDQQAVKRGSQPWYYYLLIQVPIYEYLAALGSLLAAYLGLRRWTRPDDRPNESRKAEGAAFESDAQAGDDPSASALALPLLGFWALTSLAAYTIAGEKMPWLTVHIALPMILIAGWGLGRLIETTDWEHFRSQRGLLVVAILPVFFTSLLAFLGALAGANPPFQGRELAQLQTTSTFLTALITAVVSGWGLFQLLKAWPDGQIGRVLTLTIAAMLAVLTARASFLASYTNYDNAKEYLVYAHAARGVKEVMAQVEDISLRTTDGLALQVAYDDDVSWPFTWYLRNFSNQRYYADNPSRELRDLPVILVGDNNYGKVEPIVGQAYHRFDYIRMVWPDQDYFNLDTTRVLDAVRNPEMRYALFDIWLGRDFSEYARLTGKDMSLENWNPSDRMRMYVRKDVAAKLWDYGVGPAPEEVVADPYEGGYLAREAAVIVGGPGAEPGQFQAPRALDVAPDGSLYVADSRNHRIQRLSPDGEVQQVWGTFADLAAGSAPGGTFNEPWGVAVGPDGSVYVADTWNHRVQKFTAEGEFVAMWGYFGQAEDGFAVWGPRDLAVDSQGRVLVTDTGNKRVVVFDADGNFLTEFGGPGIGPGEFDEPVGIAASGERVFVADTWNQRIQAMVLGEDGQYTPETSWEVAAWYGQSLENKPYLDAGPENLLVAADPEGARVLEFTETGDFLRYWGDFGSGPGSFGLASGLAVDETGGVWVSDGENNRLMYFAPPEA
jgi:uncharacterized protein (TIGR03663 family)